MKINWVYTMLNFFYLIEPERHVHRQSIPYGIPIHHNTKAFKCHQRRISCILAKFGTTPLSFSTITRINSSTTCNQLAQQMRHTMNWGMREAPYFVLNTLSKTATSVLSRPGTSAFVCKALQTRNKTNSIETKFKFHEKFGDFHQTVDMHTNPQPKIERILKSSTKTWKKNLWVEAEKGFT